MHQRQLNEDNHSFTNALRAALREEPDVILVGKRRDLGTIQLAISAAETGEMDKMLNKIANFYEDEVEAMVKALTSMLKPAMIVVVGGIVRSILLAMYLPMFTAFDQNQWLI